MRIAQRGHVADVAEAVDVYVVKRAARQAVVADAAEVDGAGVEDAHTHAHRLGQQRNVRVALHDVAAEADGRVEDRVGALGQHRPPALELSRRDRGAVDIMSTWLWTIAAPAARHSSASAAISAGAHGTCGLRALLVMPLIAASMMTGFMAP